ncbi:hypothetical protein ED28_09570 [[Pantoea] beijingensis]|uniref:PNPLA domain-containing protein n=1 Tax=[Pantoea] beijingensis TaxID=1324864 RepID=A0A443ICN1_9GAMM|nr:hypothetical protein ED28_09570 [[Pantoea] beijingensis]
MRYVAVGALSALCSACYFPKQLTSGQPSVFQSNQTNEEEQNIPAYRPLVGVAISGGGNRSALYASYLFELLGSIPVNVPDPHQPAVDKQESLLNTISYISSVSGGGFASAYFSLKGPGNYGSLLADPPPPAMTQFFQQYHETMNFNWQRNLLSINPFSGFVNNLSNTIDQQITHGMTLKDLDDLQASGKSPYLIFNTTHYDTGRRFLITTIPSSKFCLNVEGFLRNSFKATMNKSMDINAMYYKWIYNCQRDDSLTPEGFDSFYTTRRISVKSEDFSLAQAVALSGSFPVALGPVAWQIDDDKKRLLHIVDGGVTDNSGLESLLQLFIRKLLISPQRRALILDFDASLPFNATGDVFADQTNRFKVLLRDPSRLSDIQSIRADSFRKDLWSVVQELSDSQNSDNVVRRISIKTMKPIDLNISQLKIDTEGCHQQLSSKEQVSRAVANVPTNYHLDDCSTQFVRIAACWSAHTHAQDIQAFFRRSATDSQGSETTLSLLDQRVRKMCPELVTAGAL